MSRISFEWYPSHATKTIIFLGGWANTTKEYGIQRFIDEFNHHGFDIIFVEIGTQIHNFQCALREIQQKVDKSPEKPIIIAFSMGAVFARYLTNTGKKIYIAPYWKTSGWIISERFSKILLRLLSLIGLGKALILPKGYKTEGRQHLDAKTVLEITSAQEQMPEVNRQDHVLYSQLDSVIDVERVEKLIAETGINHHLISGLHHFFSGINGEPDEVVKIILEIIKDAD